MDDPIAAGPTVRTVEVAVTVEIDPVQGSRFVADLAPADTEAVARGFVDEIRSREVGASHHSWAYGSAAAAALDAATIRERPVLTTLTFVHAYALEGSVQAVLSAHEVEVVTAVFGAEVRRTVRLPAVRAASFAADLGEATAGQVAVVVDV